MWISLMVEYGCIEIVTRESWHAALYTEMRNERLKKSRDVDRKNDISETTWNKH
jgi:hypothetical protein